MRSFYCALTLIIFLVITGCSGSQSPVPADLDIEQTTSAIAFNSNRAVWGYWDIKITSIDAPVEIIPNREVAMHFNVVRMLEVKPCSGCLTIENLLFWLPDNIIQCDLRIQHPYSENVRLTGFDVRGIFISEGETQFPASDRLVSYDGTLPRLLEPDGYTALFNLTEFPEGSAPFPALGYIKGKSATGGNLTATLNPYVAYGIDNPRRMFEVGSFESRTIQVQFPETPIEFGYAVDASWIPVDKVVDPITDFPPEANCLEPYRLDMTILETIEDNPGSSAPVLVEVFDHQGADTINSVSLECPELFEGDLLLEYSDQTGDESWMYTGTIENVLGASVGTYPVLVKAVSLDGDANLGELTAFHVSEVSVYPPDSGNLMWAKRAGSPYEYEHPTAITALSDNSTVVTGFFCGPVVFGEGEPNEITLYSIGSYNFFIARYRADGILDWAKSIGGNDYVIGQGIAAFPDDSFVVTGFFNSTVTFGEGEPNETILYPEGGCDVFIARYNPDGTLIWVKQAGGLQGCASGSSATTLSDDSTVVTGVLWSSATFGEGEPNETTLNASNNSDYFVARYNPDGTFLWAKSFIASSDLMLYTNEIVEATTLSDDTTVITGRFNESITFGAGEPNETILNSVGVYDIFIAGYSPDGNLAWAKRAGGSSNDVGYSVTSLSDDSAVVTGSFRGSAVFGEGEPNETIMDSPWVTRAFIARYNPDGTLAWAKSTGGSTGYGITTLSDNSFVTIGTFGGSTIFGEGEPNETTLDSAGSSDVFISRYNPDSSLVWAKRGGGLSIDQAWRITALSDDSTVVTGWFYDSPVFGEGEPNETVLNSAGKEDIFVVRFHP